MVFKPIAEITNKAANKIGDAIDGSNISVLKGAKELGKTTVSATGEALTGFIGGAKQVGGAVGSSTKSIIKKKYGEDINKTFLETS